MSFWGKYGTFEAKGENVKEKRENKINKKKIEVWIK
jgi:hypothetical protein